MESSLKRILDAYRADLPLREASTIPAEWYFDPRIAELERRRVFGSSWQLAGRTAQVAAPGQYITTEIAGEPIVVVRGADGVLRAFFNVCRHHAAAVVTEPAGTATLFRCPYHGWSYGSSGELKGVPEFQGVCNFDRDANGLRPVRVDTWENFVFVNLDSAAGSLSEFLGTLTARVRPLELRRLRFVESRRYDLNCNWKVFVDNYLDGGYHVPHLHKGLNSVLDYTHYTVENGERFNVQSSPMCAPSEDPATASTRTGARAWYFWLYPNFMLNWYEGVMDTNLVIPRGVDRTVVVFDFYFAGEDAARNRQSMDVSERIQQEDVAICESVQHGLRSQAYQAGRLSVRREAGEHLFHRLLAADLRREHNAALSAA